MRRRLSFRRRYTISPRNASPGQMFWLAFLQALVLTFVIFTTRPAQAGEFPAPVPPVANDSMIDPSKIFGKVQIVDAFPDYKVKVVSSFADLRVQQVSAFADAPGKWQIVNSFPDYKIQIVKSFPDFTIQYVTAFPGSD